jgi:hypothetical protein
MANNINCTCGHSWSKASSSKKDMYVCHICGKDNTMKDGGWLGKYKEEKCDSCDKAQLGYKLGKSEDEVRQAVLKKAAEVFAGSKKPYKLPESIQQAEGGGSNVCIRGVCGILTDAGFIPDKYYTNTSFAGEASALGLGSPQTDINLLKPGDVFQHLADKNEQGHYYPTHAEIFKGWNGDKAEFYDYYDFYNFPLSMSSGIRTYDRSELEGRLSRKAKNDHSDYQAQFFSLSGAQNKATKSFPYNLPENELKDYFEKTHAANTTFSAPAPTIDKDSPLYYSSGEDVRQGSREGLANMFNDKELDKQLKRELKITDQDLQRIKPLVYGVIGQESQFDNPRSTAGGLKYMFENMFSPKGKSLGPGQIKLKSITPSVKEAFGIKKGSDLQDLKNTYVGLADIISKSANITDKYVSQETHPDLVDKDRFERALYFLNSPGKVRRSDKQNYDKSLQSNSILTNFSEQAMMDAVDRANKTKLSMDPGSYPAKVLDRAKELKTNIDFEDTSILPEVVVTSTKKKKEDGGWLNKFEQGGMVLKQKTDNYGKKPNPNNVEVSVGPDFVGLAYDTTGRNYSPAWGGQFQSGGRLPIITNNPKDSKLKAYQDSLSLYNKSKKAIGRNAVSKKNTPVYIKKGIDKKELSRDAYDFLRNQPIDISGRFDINMNPNNNFPAPKVKQEIMPIGGIGINEGNSMGGWYNIYKKPVQPVEYKKLEEIKPTQPTPKGSKKYIVNGMEVSEEDFLGSGATTGGGKRVIYNTPNKGTQQVLRLDGTPETDPDKIRRALTTANKDNMAMGGSMPGAVGFTYARVAGSAPSNGKYAKKTKASAQNGKEMKFYQEGLDFKPNSIAQDGGAIVDPMGQWAHPGEVTIIPDTNITMEGVDYPVLGISDTGDQQMMYPGEDYNFDGEYVTEYPMMQKGGWLSKYQEKAPSDATRVSAPVKPLTKKEQKENVRINKQTQKNTEELNKAIVAERKSKRETKGDVNVPGSFNITEKFRLFPKSVGGIGEVIDEYVNPGTFVGRLADSLGESVAARSPEGVATTLAMTAGAGALGFDPLGSALKSKTLRTAIEESNGIARTIRDIPRAENVKEAIGRIGGIPLKKDIPRMAAEDVKALRQVQEIGRLRATNSPLANQMKYGLETNLPEEHFQKVFGKSREEAQKLLNSGFGEQEAAKSANIRSRIDLRRNRGSDLDADRLNALGENNVVNPRQTVDRNEVLDELLQRATQPISESRYRSLSSDEILNNFNRSYTTETKMTGSMKNFDRKLNSLIYKNIQDYPYYSGEVLQKVPSLNLSGSGNLKEVSKKVNFAPEGISSGDVFTGSTNTSHSSWLPQIKQVFKYDKGTPQFLGYQPMNSLGFLSGYGYDEKDIAKYLNSEIDEQIKRGVIPKNISRPFQKGEHVMLPHYGIKQNKNGGWLTKYK